MSTNNESSSGSSDQGKQPRDEVVSSPFGTSYELPDDQFKAELQLVDSFARTYPEEAHLLNGFLTKVKMHGGMQIPYYQLDRPVEGLEQLPSGHLVGDYTMLYSNIPLKTPIAEEPRLEILEGTPAELEVYAAGRDALSVQEEVPAYARQMIEGVYSLVGAEVIHFRTENGVDRTIRRGAYLGNPVYFVERRTIASTSGVVSYSISLDAEKFALFEAEAEIYGADLEECMQLTGLTRQQIKKMNQEGSLTRANFREQAALFQAVNDAMDPDGETK